jgi:cobaltochelatase CobS
MKSSRIKGIRMSVTVADMPTQMISVKDVFGINSRLQVQSFATRRQHVPEIDPDYRFDPEATLAILAGFARNRRVMLTGLHGTGKSTHIEQVAARLNWPCIRVNLDGHLSRSDLIGRDAIVLRDGQQITEFREGLLPWALQNPCAMVFDEYDAGRPDVMFVIQRVLEANGHLTLLDENRIIPPHPAFRLFATANTIGAGDAAALYHGTQQVNQGQLDRWTVVASLGYLPFEREVDIVLAKCPHMSGPDGRETVERMVRLAGLTRQAFANHDMATLISTRSVVAWAENMEIFEDRQFSFRVTVLNKCDEVDRNLLAELYQRCFDEMMSVPLSSSAA